MGGKRPRESDLRRAVSTTYYALFHAMCQNCADGLIGGKSADRSTAAWTQTYRAANHNNVKSACQNQRVMKLFPKEIEDFGNMFVQLQLKRHAADYDPAFRITRSEVLNDIDAAEEAIHEFRRTPMKDRRAFAAWILFRRD